MIAVSLTARPAHGQFVVNDPLNIAQAIALVQKDDSMSIGKIVQQYKTIVRMSQGLQKHRPGTGPCPSHSLRMIPHVGRTVRRGSPR